MHIRGTSAHRLCMLRTTVFDLFVDYIYLFEHTYSPTHKYVPLSSLGLVSGIKYRVMPKTFILSQLYMSYFFLFSCT